MGLCWLYNLIDSWSWIANLESSDEIVKFSRVYLKAILVCLWSKKGRQKANSIFH